MNEVLNNIYERRSVRSFKEQVPSDEELKEIIKAGTFAPNGTNAQGLRFVVISDRALLKKYSTVAKALFVDIIKKQLEKLPADKTEGPKRMMQTLSNPDFNIFYDAPTLILVLANPSCLTPMEDGAAAAENMMLAAWSMGIGSCWIGFANPLQHSTEFLNEMGIPSDHRLIAPIILGYPKKAPPKGKRNEPEILKWIR